MKTKQTRMRLLKKKLDKAWSLAIRARDKRCIVCGSDKSLQAHHAIVRKAQSLGVRWLINNGVTLCYTCHIHKLHGQQGDKAWLDRYLTVINDIIPKEVQENIQQIGHQVNKFSESDLEEMLKSLQERT